LGSKKDFRCMTLSLADMLPRPLVGDDDSTVLVLL
jgi:hypothetical protein